MNPMRTCLLLALAVVGAAALDIGDPAPRLDGVDWIKNGPAQPGGGTATVVEFWATWCPPCRQSIPHLTKLQHAHAGKLRVIGLSDEERATVEPFVTQQGAAMDYAVGVADQAAKEAYMAGIESIPHAFLADGGGTIVWSGHPMELDAVVDAVLAGTFDAAAAQRLGAVRTQLQTALQGQNPDLDKALDLTRQILAQQPLDEQAIQLRLAIAKHTEKRDVYRATLAAIPLDRGTAEQLNALAWNQLDEEGPAWRDIAFAVRCARRARELAPDKVQIADTWARALYELGLLDAAIAAQEQAVGAAKQAGDDDADSLQRMLDYYREVKKVRASVGDQSTTSAAPAMTP